MAYRQGFCSADRLFLCSTTIHTKTPTEVFKVSRMQDRQRLLMVCYYYPPIRAVGAQRSVAFSSLLQKFGWDVTVLTVRDSKDPWTRNRGAEIPAGVRVERALEINLSSVVDFLHAGLCRVWRLFGKELQTNYFREWLCIPDPQIAWLCHYKLLRLCGDHDLIYVSCSPFSAAVTASLIKRLKGLKGASLFLDFRDPWTLNPHLRHSRFHNRVSRTLERFAIRTADGVILTTEGTRALYERHFPEYRHKFHVIPNGYDIQNRADTVTISPFRIIYVGNFYGTRSARSLLRALAELDLPDTEFVVVGGAVPEYEEFKDRVRIRQIPSVEHGEALAWMRRASLLYLKQGWESGISDYVAVAAKTYEYLCTGLPILADLPPGDNLELIQHFAQRCYIVVEPDSTSRLKEVVQTAYDERYSFSVSVSEEFLHEYNRENLASTLAAVFRTTHQKTT